MAKGPMTWSEDQLRELIREELAKSRGLPGRCGETGRPCGVSPFDEEQSCAGDCLGRPESGPKGEDGLKLGDVFKVEGGHARITRVWHDHGALSGITVDVVRPVDVEPARAAPQAAVRGCSARSRPETPAPPGWPSWASYARWRIDGLLAAIDRWRSRAMHANSIIASLNWRLDNQASTIRKYRARAEAAEGDQACPGPTLIEGLIDMIAGGRLTEADVPDDWAWLVAKIGEDRIEAARSERLRDWA